MFTSLEGSYSPFGESGCYHEGTPTPRRLTLFPLKYHHEGDSQPLVVDLEVASKPSQTFRGGKSQVDSSPEHSYRLEVSNLYV